MNAYTERVIRRTAAASHEDQPGTDAAKARRWSTSRRTQNRWGHDGPPAIRDAQTYLLNCPNPFRAFATLKVSEIQARLREQTTPDLIARYHDLLAAEKDQEAEDTRHDLCRRTGWLDKSLSSERDAALDTEKAAIERIFAERRVGQEEVWG